LLYRYFPELHHDLTNYFTTVFVSVRHKKVKLQFFIRQFYNASTAASGLEVVVV